ncbi:WD40-repeat-containing domain protein [Phakopsora pachyrhizi]|nr:WD40-repeat-containing domain protein [Phakopsora pachyrhizi]
MLHNLSLAWPALSFDVLRDDLGEERRKMPHSACIVAGTQAEARGDVDQDEIMIMKWEGLSKMARDPDYVDEDDDDEDDDDDDDDDGVDEDPILTYKTIPHKSSVNRVKAQALPLPLSSPPPRPPDHYFIASFSGAGKVHIFDIAPHLFALQSPQLANDQTTLSKRPYHTINQHGRAEGFALSWGPPPPSSTNQSSPSSLRLLSGDVCSKIYLTVSDQSGFTTQSKPFTSHTSSVEDIQWSPTEQTVFASCSADQSLKIWDVRVKDRRSVLGVQKAHPTDVNVLSWNLKTSYLIVSGGDEGGIKVWDLRNLQTNKSTTRLSSISGEEEPVAMFNWHKAPITSIEWHPTEDSCFISSSADDQVTIWDLSVEIDEEEERLRSKKMRSDGDDDLLIDQKIPPQLMFVHHGQSEIKEVHWHPQIPGTIISTALDGLNVFKTISV